MRRREPTDCILEGFTATGRPDQEKDQAVAHDAQRCFFDTSYNSLKIVQRVGAAGKCKERYREPGDVPEIPSGGTRHHVGAEASEEAHADQEQPAILREQGNESDGRQTPQKGPGQPQQALVQRFSDGRQGTERHGKGGPIGIFPVHGKRDAIGKYHGERGLDCRLDPIRHHSLARHVCQHLSSSAQLRPSARYRAKGLRAAAEAVDDKSLAERPIRRYANSTNGCRFVGTGVIGSRGCLRRAT